MPWSQNFLVVPSFCLQGNSHYHKIPGSRALATAFVQSAAFNLKKIWLIWLFSAPTVMPSREVISGLVAFPAIIQLMY